MSISTYRQGENRVIPLRVMRYCLPGGKKSLVREESPFSLHTFHQSIVKFRTALQIVGRLVTDHCQTGNLNVKKSPAATNSSTFPGKRNIICEVRPRHTRCYATMLLEFALSKDLRCIQSYSTLKRASRGILLERKTARWRPSLVIDNLEPPNIGSIHISSRLCTS